MEQQQQQQQGEKEREERKRRRKDNFFEALLEEERREGKKYRQITDKDQLEEYINSIQHNARLKTPTDYRLKNLYDVKTINGIQRLIRRKTDTYYVCKEEMFDAINEVHVRLCHGGVKRTYIELKKTIANITYKQINLFIELCITCEKKRRITRKHQVVRPLISTQFGERAQMDLIDIRTVQQPQHPKKYNYIFHYQDHFTKFSILEPLEHKRADDVAEILHKIFASFGAPKILQSDNGCEFSTSVLKPLLKTRWPTMKFVHGSPRHPQSQGSVERANADIENMIRSLLQEDPQIGWIKCLNYVQHAKNITYHRIIGTSPYKAVFGHDPPVPMKGLVVEEDMTEEEEEEEELILSTTTTTTTTTTTVTTAADVIVPQTSATGEEEEEEEEEVSTTTTTNNRPPPLLLSSNTAIVAEEIEVVAATTTTTEDNEEERREKLKTNIYQGILKQARVMLKKVSTTNAVEDINVNDCVIIHIPLVDRPNKVTMKNLLGIIVDIKSSASTSGRIYDVATRFGRIKPRLSRNQFDLCRRRNLFSNLIVDKVKQLTLREAVSKEAGEDNIAGVKKCKCTTKCDTNRCICRRMRMFCSQYCRHNHRNCINKDQK